MKNVMKDVSLKLITNTHIIYTTHIDFPFLSESMKIKNVEKLKSNLRDKTEYSIYIRNLKRALNHGLVIKRYIE